MTPILSKLYNVSPSAVITATQASIVHYYPGESHMIHNDDSDITLNICLGRLFSGGDLQFFDLDTSDPEVLPESDAPKER